MPSCSRVGVDAGGRETVAEGAVVQTKGLFENRTCAEAGEALQTERGSLVARKQRHVRMVHEMAGGVGMVPSVLRRMVLGRMTLTLMLNTFGFDRMPEFRRSEVLELLRC